MAAKTKTPATSADVRKWAAENGHTVKERGRFDSKIIEAYNAKNKARPYESGIKPEGKKIQVKGRRLAKDGKRRVPYSAMVSMTDIRNAAAEAGVRIGVRGRIPQDIIDAFANGDLAEFAKNQPEAGPSIPSARRRGEWIDPEPPCDDDADDTVTDEVDAADDEPVESDEQDSNDDDVTEVTLAQGESLTLTL